jgi:hypothetical protein
MKEAIINNDKNIGGHGDGHAKLEDHICNLGLPLNLKRVLGMFLNGVLVGFGKW